MYTKHLHVRKHMVVFLCIDYTLWPGWNHRGVYLYSREPELKVSRSSTPSTGVW